MEKIHNLYITSVNKQGTDTNYNYNLYFSNYGIVIGQDEEAYLNIKTFQSLKTRPVEHPRLAHLAWNFQVSFLRSTRLGRTVVRSKLQSPSSHNELLLPTEAGGARVRAGSDASPSRHAPW